MTDTDTIEARVESCIIRDEDGNAYTNAAVIRLNKDEWYLKVYCGK